MNQSDNILYCISGKCSIFRFFSWIKECWIISYCGFRNHRSRNWGGQGGPPPQYINQGGPGPTNVGAIKGSFTVKMDFLINNFLGSSTNFNFKNFYTHKTGRCTHMYTLICHQKKSAPPISNIFLLHWKLSLNFVDII